MNFKITFIFLVSFFAVISCARHTEDHVTIKGHVTDYQNNPLDSVSVTWQDEHFEKTLFEAITDSAGYYELKIKKGRYRAMGALNMSEYIVAGSTLPEEDLRLEFWGWNFIADRDTTFNMQYHRLEVYGLNVFRIEGGTPAYTIYCRPMSMTRFLYDRKNPANRIRLAPSPENLAVKVTIDGEEVAVRSKKEVEEYWSDTTSSNAYILTVDLPKAQHNRPYRVFKVQMTDLENGDRGEAVYFLEKKEYIN
jgi:hypothetical protein